MRDRSSRLHLLPRFRQDRSGGVAIVFGITAILVVALVGGSVDGSRAYLARSRVQGAVDAAALAGASQYILDPNHSDSAAITRAETYLASMLGSSSGITATTTLDTQTGTLKMSVDYAVPTPFLAVIGISNMNVNAYAEATTASAGMPGSESGISIEMSLMLDTTGSMGEASGSGGTKLDAMKTAVLNMLDVVLPDGRTPNVKVALAPFAPTVNVGSLVNDVTGLAATINSGKRKQYLRHCVLERTGPDEFTDAAPADGAYVPVLDSFGNGGYVPNATGAETCNPSQTIVPLTAGKGLLKNTVKDFSAGGSTAGALGTAWAWYLLSPEWSGIFKGNSAPAAYGTPKLRKVAILLTDGIYNTYAGMPSWDGSAQAIATSEKAVRLCDGMKAKGIEVFTIGFKLDNNLAKTTMHDCASGSDHAFLAEDGDQLSDVFKSITYQVVPLHIAR